MDLDTTQLTVEWVATGRLYCSPRLPESYHQVLYDALRDAMGGEEYDP